MFATLLGPLPRPPLADDAAPEALLDAVLACQVAHGLEPLTAAGWGIDARGARDGGREDPVGAWRSAAARTDQLVKAVVAGPRAGDSDRDVSALRATMRDLADAGCAWIEIVESVPGLGVSKPDAATRFAAAHVALTDGFDGVHLSLALLGGDAEPLGIDALLAGAYSSMAFDLIDGPDHWRLIAATPGDRGIVAGALSTRAGSDDGPELLLWAVGYAASTGGRGGDRVGLATAGSLAHLPWEVAARKVERLGVAARLATSPPDEIRDAVDPRALDSRSGALGRYTPRPPRRRP